MLSIAGGRLACCNCGLKQSVMMSQLSFSGAELSTTAAAVSVAQPLDHKSLEYVQLSQSRRTQRDACQQLPCQATEGPRGRSH